MNYEQWAEKFWDLDDGQFKCKHSIDEVVPYTYACEHCSLSASVIAEISIAALGWNACFEAFTHGQIKLPTTKPAGFIADGDSPPDVI